MKYILFLTVSVYCALTDLYMLDKVYLDLVLCAFHFLLVTFYREIQMRTGKTLSNTQQYIIYILRYLSV